MNIRNMPQKQFEKWLERKDRYRDHRARVKREDKQVIRIYLGK